MGSNLYGFSLYPAPLIRPGKTIGQFDGSTASFTPGGSENAIRLSNGQDNAIWYTEASGGQAVLPSKNTFAAMGQNDDVVYHV